MLAILWEVLFSEPVSETNQKRAVRIVLTSLAPQAQRYEGPHFGGRMGLVPRSPPFFKGLAKVPLTGLDLPQREINSERTIR